MSIISRSHLASPAIAALTFALALGGAACQDATPTAPAASAPAVIARPIVNGQTETGWPGVGALTIKSGNRYYGAYCSGTLIAPNWVLTAGHCTAGSELAQQGITAQTTSFFVGNDARPVGQSGAPAGKYFQADAFVPFDDYDPQSNDNDIGLVHLKDAATDVPVYPFNADDLKAFVNAWTGEAAPSLLTVGYGATEGINQSGSGLKRSTHINIDSVITESYVSKFIDTGTCFGDSGGPGFLEIGGETRIIGITSAGGNCPMSNPNCDPCTTETYSTRVDVYADWIQKKITGPAPDCINTPQLCLCAEACTTDGTCDDSVVCHIASCQETYFCIRQCQGDLHCEGACKEAATDEAKPQVDALLACAAAQCAGLSGQQRRQCLQDKCTTELSVCFGFGPTTTGNDTCEQVYDCMSACETGSCQSACLDEGTAQAQQQLTSLVQCLHGSCADQVTDQGFTACAHVSCGAQFDACIPPVTGDKDCAFVDTCVQACDESDLPCPDQCYSLGSAVAQDAYDDLALCVADACGDAADLEACRAASCADFATACDPVVVPPAPKAEGEACAAGDTCADGLVCTAGASGSTCEKPCVDADLDGVCADLDCNDADAAVHPGATELCGNAIDDNCNDQSEEGCAPVTPIVPGGKDDGCAGSGSELSLVGVGLALALVARRRRVA